jgi:RimJ/RimL family protein N-acetyltransferase
MTSQEQGVSLEPEAARSSIMTRRLLLRAPSIADLSALTRLVNDPVIARNTSSIRYPYAPIEGWRFIRASASNAGPQRFAHFLITLRGNPRQIVGAAGFDWRPGHDPELGYWIAAAHRRRGFAVEVTRALLRRIFAASVVQQVQAWCRVENTASQRVLWRAGFRRTGTGRVYSKSLRRYTPAIQFVITRAKWRRASQRSGQATGAAENPDAHL